MKARWIGLFTAVAMAFTLLLAGPWAVEAQTTVYSISPRDDQLRTISPGTAATLSSTPITLAGETVLGGTGLAINPLSGELWALLRLDGQAGRQLVTIDPTPPNCVATCVATSVGDTGGAFAGLAFSPGGTLFGVTGEMTTGGLDPETLFTLSTTTATPTPVCSVDATVTGGQAIAFHPGGLLYHAAGIGDTVFETVDTGAACATTDIPIGDSLKAKEVSALGFYSPSSAFLWAQGTSTDMGPGKAPALQLVTPGGAATPIGPLDHVSKGLAVSVIPVPLSPFACYTAAAAVKLTPVNVTIEDQFREAMVTVAKVITLCNPSDVEGAFPGAEGLPDHLVGYSITQSVPPKFPGVDGIEVNDMFGAIFVDAVTPVTLLVPSAKSLISPPLLPPEFAIDHFVCYTVKATPGKPRFVRINDVVLQDQFDTRTVDLSKTSRLCNPVNKNGEEPGAESHPGHLMCYETQGSTPSTSTKDPVFVNNQFGPQQLKSTTGGELCVPALKTLAP